MRKQLIALALILALAAAVIACGRTDTTGYVEPAMEGTTITETTSELSTETALLAAESESAAQTEATSFSAGKTAVLDIAVSTAAKPTEIAARQTAAKPAATTIAPAVTTPATAAQTTTTTRYVPPQTAAVTTTTRHAPLSTTLTVTTTQYVSPTTTTTTAPTTKPQALSDYEAMGQALYQEEALKALNAMRAERGLLPMTVNATLTANSLAHAQKMAAAGKEFHSTENLPGCESVSRIPANFPAKLLGETLANHTPQFLESSRSSVGIAVIRQGSYLYAVMQGA